MRFTITDTNGIPLDLNGEFTEGRVAPSFAIAAFDTDANGRANGYIPYTTRMATAGSVTAEQPSTDTGGVYTEVGLGEGTYEYQFGTAVEPESAADTHTVAVWATRTFEGTRYVANEVFSFVPEGGEPLAREIVSDASCNNCHGEVEAHGGARRGVEVCNVCHTSTSIDPDTGNSLDFKVMIHKIHRGELLPSVQAGEAYRIIGYQASVHDYSHVVLPQPANNCTTCHEGETADHYKLRPSRETCTSCHDRTAFVEPAPAGMTLHGPGPIDDDRICSGCHKPTDTTRSIDIEHFVGPQLNPANPKIDLAITAATNTGPGQIPQIRFTVSQNGAPRNILGAGLALASLRATIAGPTTDYATYWQATIQPPPASNAGTLVADGDGFLFTFPAAAAIPLTATGSYAVSLEGNVRFPDPVAGERIPTNNPIRFVAVTDPTPVPRREVVEMEKCNNCHYDLQFHGGNRKDVQYCVFCHNPNNVNDERFSRLESSTVAVPSVNLKDMLHKIHMGEHLTQPYVLGGNPTPSIANPAGTLVDFSHVRLPRSPANCAGCHSEGTESLPLAAGVLPTRMEVLTCTEVPANDADSLCATRASAVSFIPPESAACTSCHDAPSTAAHAELNRTGSGLEACATCHGPGAAFDAAIAHSP